MIDALSGVPTYDMILTVLQESESPLPVADLRKHIRDRFELRVPRPTVYSALARLATRGLVGAVDDPGFPRRWLAAPVDVAARVNWDGR